MTALGFNIGISYRSHYLLGRFPATSKRMGEGPSTYGVVRSVRWFYRWLIGARCPSHVSVEGLAIALIVHSLDRSSRPVQKRYYRQAKARESDDIITVLVIV